jgi:hypothetical protein
LFVFETAAWRLIAGQYSGSLLKALSDVYRDHKWLPWKFQQVSAGFWDSPANQRDYFDWLGKELGIVTLEGSLLLELTEVIHL